MNGVTVEPKRWGPRQWWRIVALVFLVQLGLIFWLGERGEKPVRPPGAAPVLQFAGGAVSEWLALQDPTLFALPHWQGFAGSAWLKAPDIEPPDNMWHEPDYWLEPSREQLATPFQEFLQTNVVSTLAGIELAEPELTASKTVQAGLFWQHSVLRLGGDLARRRLLTPIQLPSWTNSELLTNSVIQLVVAADGTPLSPMPLLVPPTCGLKQADDFALEQAREMRFESLLGRGPDAASNTSSAPSWGTIIFQWHTVLVPATNAAAGGP
jgi:hypothetical protein